MESNYDQKCSLKFQDTFQKSIFVRLDSIHGPDFQKSLLVFYTIGYTFYEQELIQKLSQIFKLSNDDSQEDDIIF